MWKVGIWLWWRHISHYMGLSFSQVRWPHGKLPCESQEYVNLCHQTTSMGSLWIIWCYCLLLSNVVPWNHFAQLLHLSVNSCDNCISKRDSSCYTWPRISSFVQTAAESLAQNHRIIKTGKGWKRPPRSPSPTFDWAPPCQLNYSTKCHVQLFLEHSTDSDFTPPWTVCPDALTIISLKKFSLVSNRSSNLKESFLVQLNSLAKHV